MVRHREEPPALDGTVQGRDEAYAELAAQMRSLHISRISEMPRIELYLDQVLSLVSSELSFMYGPDEKVVTGAMVNNYVKQRIVPAPVRKRYTRRHLATLLFVCAFKRVLSIGQVGQVFSLAVAESVDVEQAYDALIGLLERMLAELFAEDSATRAEGPMPELALVSVEGERVSAELEVLLQNAVLLLATKVYADRMLALPAA